MSENQMYPPASAELAAKIRAAQSHSTVRQGSGQLIWPVNAPITSPFGWRWGRMHEGIDLGAAYGTPIAAAAAGTVIYAGWLGGYGHPLVPDPRGGRGARDGEGGAGRFGRGRGVALVQALAALPGRVRAGAVADRAARDRKLRNGHREGGGT